MDYYLTNQRRKLCSQQKRILRRHHGKIQMGIEKASDYMCLRKPIHNRPCHVKQERRVYYPQIQRNTRRAGQDARRNVLVKTGEELNPRIIKSDNARLDISAVGFWARGEQAFFDTRIFNPFALKHRRQIQTQ